MPDVISLCIQRMVWSCWGILGLEPYICHETDQAQIHFAQLGEYSNFCLSVNTY